MQKASLIKIVAIVIAYENQEEKVKQVIMKCIEPSRKEEGTV